MKNPNDARFHSGDFNGGSHDGNLRMTDETLKIGRALARVSDRRNDAVANGLECATLSSVVTILQRSGKS